MQELVALGHGVSLIPQMAVDADKSQRRKYRSISGSKPTRTIAMIWRKDRSQGTLVKRFIEAAQSGTAALRNGKVAGVSKSTAANLPFAESLISGN